MTTTFDWPDPDDDPDERDAHQSEAPDASVSDADRAAHKVFIEAISFFAEKCYIDRDAAMDLVKNLEVGAMPRGRSKFDQQAREIWLYVRAKDTPIKAFDGTDAPNFASADDKQAYSKWMAWDLRREFAKPASEEDSDGSTA